jgi:hypothetical protein
MTEIIIDANYNSMENFNKLVEKGDIELCPNCNQYSAYAWMDVNIDVHTGLRLTNDDGFSDDNEPYTDDEILTNWPDVYSIPSASGFEWQCGNCKTSWMEKDSPIAANCYTHCDE